MNAFSVLGHEISKIKENICIFFKKCQQKQPGWLLFPMCCLMRLVSTHFLNPAVLHWMVPSVESLSSGETTQMHFRANSNISRAKVTSVCDHLPVTVCLMHLSRQWFVLLEIFLSRSEDAPWLSAAGHVRLVHAGGFLMPGWSHPYSSTLLEHFLDWTSPLRHTHEPPVAASWWVTLKTVRCHTAANAKRGTGEDTRPWSLKWFKKESFKEV